MFKLAVSKLVEALKIFADPPKDRRQLVIDIDKNERKISEITSKIDGAGARMSAASKFDLRARLCGELHKLQLAKVALLYAERGWSLSSSLDAKERFEIVRAIEVQEAELEIASDILFQVEAYGVRDASKGGSGPMFASKVRSGESRLRMLEEQLMMHDQKEAFDASRRI